MQINYGIFGHIFALTLNFVLHFAWSGIHVRTTHEMYDFSNLGPYIVYIVCVSRLEAMPLLLGGEIFLTCTFDQRGRTIDGYTVCALQRCRHCYSGAVTCILFTPFFLINAEPHLLASFVIFFSLV